MTLSEWANPACPLCGHECKWRHFTLPSGEWVEKRCLSKECNYHPNRPVVDGEVLV